MQENTLHRPLTFASVRRLSARAVERCGVLPNNWSMCYESLEANSGQGDSYDQEA